MRTPFVATLAGPRARRPGARARLSRSREPLGRLDCIAAAPHEVSLTFTQNLEPAFSTVSVTDPSGAQISQGKAQVSGNTMRVGLKSIGPGSYKVNWHALSVDTHSTQGSFTFHVGGK